jgi:hypothetical protein
VSLGERGGFSTFVNLSFLDRIAHVYKKIIENKDLEKFTDIFKQAEVVGF